MAKLRVLSPVDFGSVVENRDPPIGVQTLIYRMSLLSSSLFQNPPVNLVILLWPAFRSLIS